ncbi:hypothetical protein HELRODRAFT_72730, partial [Helobdella robusta]|uniref:Tyrosine-protein phosphatase domain-containing protein n=1 Tax=Helobdella robusta TaxID=6412 RepID=T1G145_HELRO
HKSSVAEMPENRIKNRYSNVLPFDHSRVKLYSDLDDGTTNDYINASYVPVCHEENFHREFIACQSPMRSTLEDFWKLLWQQNVQIVVMLTNLFETGKEKCYEYWPTQFDEYISYGDIQVVETCMLHNSSFEYHIKTKFCVKLHGGDILRKLEQFHFISWPDLKCPLVPTFLEFFRDIKNHLKKLQTNEGPVLVHCSSGSGRAGIYILLDRLVKQLDDCGLDGEINVFNNVLEMRDARCNMVQSEVNATFISISLTSFQYHYSFLYYLILFNIISFLYRILV